MFWTGILLVTTKGTVLHLYIKSFIKVAYVLFSFVTFFQGEKGDTGPDGANGDVGEIGLKGSEGPLGPPGLTGVRVSALGGNSRFHSVQQ